MEERVPETAPEPPHLGPSLATLDATLAELAAWCEHCIDLDDGLARRIGEFGAFVAELREVDELDAMALLSDDRHRPSARVSRTGNKNKWRCTIDEVRAVVIQLGDALETIRRPVLEASARTASVPPCAGTRSRQPTSGGEPESWSSTICSSWRGRC